MRNFFIKWSYRSYFGSLESKSGTKTPLRMLVCWGYYEIHRAPNSSQRLPTAQTLPELAVRPTTLCLVWFPLESVPDHDEALVSAIQIVRIPDHVTGTQKKIALVHERQTGASVTVNAPSRSVVDSRPYRPTVLERVQRVLNAAD